MMPESGAYTVGKFLKDFLGLWKGSQIRVTNCPDSPKTCRVDHATDVPVH